MRLRQERERQQISIQKIAAETKIKSGYLEAIEADDLSALPGDYFYRAFVRQYAGYLGWDTETTEQMINTISSKPIVEPGIPSSGILEDPQIDGLREKLKDKPMRLAQDDGSSKRWLAIAAVLIVACATYFTYPQWISGLAGQAGASSAPQSTTAEVAPPPTSTSQSNDYQEQTLAPAAAEDAAAKQETRSAVVAPAAPEPGKFNLQLVARQMTWARILADGTRVHYGPIEAGEQKTITASSAEVLIGNAGTLDVIYNGKPLQYGEKGQVKTLLFTPDGWKFKPKPVSQEDGEGNRPATSSQTGASDSSSGGL